MGEKDMPGNVSIGSCHHSEEKEDAARHQHDNNNNINNVAATQADLPLSTAFRYYWKAVAWSVCISNATIMESYSQLLINSFYAQPQFQKRFGSPLPDGSGYSVSASWQIGLSMAILVGLIIGVFANGYCADRWGLRRVLMVSHVAMAGFIFITFFANSVEMLMVGVLLQNIPGGFFAAATPSYAAEVSPPKLSGYLTVYVNLCWVIGKMLAFGIISGTLNIQSEWAYRIPFAVQWAWPLPLLIATYLAPESPWWLVRKGRIDDARKSLERLITAPRPGDGSDISDNGSDNDGNGNAPPPVVDRDALLTWMADTIKAERENDIQGSYLDCFKGTNLRRTEIAMISWGCQILPGFAIQNYITYFFTLAGLDTADSFNISIGNAGLAFVGTCLSWVCMTHVGWRTIYLCGLIAMLPVMSLVGFLDLAVGSIGADTLRWVQCALLLLWFFLYGISIGPIPYGIAANVGASNLRVKTISLGRNTYYFLAIVNTIVSPYMLNPGEGNLKGKAAFPAAAFTLLLIAWTYFRLPEIKGMTQETLNDLFERKVPTRRFLKESKASQSDTE